MVIAYLLIRTFLSIGGFAKILLVNPCMVTWSFSKGETSREGQRNMCWYA